MQLSYCLLGFTLLFQTVIAASRPILQTIARSNGRPILTPATRSSSTSCSASSTMPTCFSNDLTIKSATYKLPFKWPAHPRLLVNSSGIKRIQEQVTEKHPNFNTLYQAHLGYVKYLGTLQLPSYSSSLYATAGALQQRIGGGATAYRLTGQISFAKDAISAMTTAASFQDWTPSTNPLALSEMITGMAVGYDLLFDVMTSAQRKIVRTAIVQKGLIASILTANNGHYWTTMTNNWGQVVNGGLIMAALTIADEEPAIAQQIFSFCMPRLARSMIGYAPDGSWAEGTGYASYAAKYMTHVLASLEHSVRHDYNLSAIKGLDKIGSFISANQGNVGKSFNFADNNEQLNYDIGWLAYLSTKYGNPYEMSFVYSIARATPSRTAYTGVLWYIPPKSVKYPDNTQIQFSKGCVTTFRTSWTSNTSWFLGTVAGDNGQSHAHLDMGSFVLDAYGQRWVNQLGGDGGLPNYYSGSTRWKYYRTRTEGQNNLAISTSPQEVLGFSNQVVGASGSITSTGNDFVIYNLTKAYSSTNSVLRGFHFLEDGIVIRDEVSATTFLDVIWQVHTNASITISADKRSASLARGAETMPISILSTSLGAYFEAVTANPCEGSSSCLENTNTGFQNLIIRGPMVKSMTLVVGFGRSSDSTAAAVPLALWSNSTLVEQ